MTQYVGLDVSMKETKLHVLDEAGKRVWRGRCASEPAAAKKALDMKVNKTDANDAEGLAHLVPCRASRQTIGKPSAVSSVQSQVVNGPVSSPTRTAAGAYRRIAAAIAAGSLAHRPRHTRLPASSST